MWSRSRLLLAAPCVVLCVVTLWWGFVPSLPSPRSGVLLYCNQCRSDLRQSFGAAISRAQASVFLASYGLSDQRILRALRKAADRGCAVTILCDKRHVPSRKQLGLHVRLVRGEQKGLMHQKLLIIDDVEVWIGSANMTRASLQLHQNLVLACRCEDLARLVRDESHAHGAVWYDDQRITFWRLPDKEALSCLKERLRCAKNTIRIAMFTWTHRELAEALIDAKSCGVRVEVVIDSTAGKGAGRGVVRQLIDAGINVRFNRGLELLHHKVAIIDDQMLILGSANWTQAAFTKNADCYLILEPLHPKQKKLLKKMWRALCCETRTPDPAKTSRSENSGDL